MVLGVLVKLIEATGFLFSLGIITSGIPLFIEDLLDSSDLAPQEGLAKLSLTTNLEESRL